MVRTVSKQDRRIVEATLGILAMTPVVIGLAFVAKWMCDDLVYYYGYDYKVYGPVIMYGSLALLFLLASLVFAPRKRHRRRDAAD